MGKVRKTKKQREIMGHVLKAAGEGVFLTPVQLHEKFSYTCTFGAARVSFRFLINNGILQRTTTAGVNTLAPTALAYEWFRPHR